MNERLILIEGIDPLALYGVNNSIFNLISSHFPKLKIIARGDELKVLGEESEIQVLEDKLNKIIDFSRRYNRISEDVVKDFLNETDDTISQAEENFGDALVYGNNGRVIKARTVNQRMLVDKYLDHDLLFAIGPAGSGKTYTAIALAVRALKNKEVKRIILTRPAVEAGERLGFLPGDLKEKLDPYLQPLYDALNDMIPARKLNDYMEEGTVQIAPLAYMRGRTLDNAFVILDEAQNTSMSQMKMFLTRMGNNAKFIVTGDVTQIDLPRREDSGLVPTLKLLQDIPGLAIVHFDSRDIIRHKLVKYIVHAFDKLTKNTEENSNQNK
ncbi:MAG: PhoH family protein [Tenuifilaceae bacterium]|jgi:phosphate starvation-inducible PhoH-like protein|uniref:PhoH family protein n=1 Tax=Perlabentimonas gracilis TaxID=2715279 RepID=UPI0014093F9B|nr:PhoH family protein [Perlabentimonas gracilis]MDX9768841.1 PhoH family protein [Tenuifilaceae bacterium]NHB68173.1 PhoH family protein [Perlabentimonas gracilis]